MRGTLEQLLAVREPVYAMADMVLEFADEPHAVLVDKIVAALRRTWDYARTHERNDHRRLGRRAATTFMSAAACWREPARC